MNNICHTGDTVTQEVHKGPSGEDLSYYRILGRSSVDILKSGGEQIHTSGNCCVDFFINYDRLLNRFRKSRPRL